VIVTVEHGPLERGLRTRVPGLRLPAFGLSGDADARHGARVMAGMMPPMAWVRGVNDCIPVV